MVQRRIPPLRTELEHKPILRDHLEQVVGGFSCAREVECRMQNCFQDTEHIISANPAQGAEPLTEVETMMKSHPDFIVRSICRWKHMRINATWNRSEPISDEFGVGYLTASPLNLNKKQKSRLKEIRKELKHGKRQT